MLPEVRSQISPAQVQAMNKAMATMSRGQREAGKVYSYDAQGHVTQLRETNFVFEKTTTILYNDHGDAVEVYTTVADNAVVPAGVSYSFDEKGNLTPSETPSATPEHLPLPPPEEVHYSHNTTAMATGRSRPQLEALARVLQPGCATEYSLTTDSALG
jgi:hypothetical protein